MECKAKAGVWDSKELAVIAHFSLDYHFYKYYISSRIDLIWGCVYDFMTLLSVGLSGEIREERKHP